ncbi:MAG: TetR/AcrR family transcriptional regulator [Kutzneria sp.]|nr:TetR/AcrR family transcriptional regulator [Kutzneria sp.]
MENKGRTQTERSETSRAALIAAARTLFAERGYASVSTPEIVAAAGLTRGALYHQFADKTALFQAVVERVEGEVMRRVQHVVGEGGGRDPLAALVSGAEAWLEACADPRVQRIVLIDAPAVLGWAHWREIGHRYGLGLVVATLRHAMDLGLIPDQPVAPLAHALVGAIDEAALYIAAAQEPGPARAEMAAVLRRLVRALADST